MEFFSDQSRNVHSLKIINTSDNILKISIDDGFEFNLDTSILKISSEEDFLDLLCQNVNKLHHTTLDTLLDTITSEYTKLMDDDIKEVTPQEFDDFPDQDDFMFESRIRFSSQDTSKLTENHLANIFSFCEPLDLVKISKTCKKWSNLSNDEKLWKIICASRKIESNGNSKSAFIQDYITKSLNFREMLKMNDGKVEKWEYFVTDFDCTKIQLRFPSGNKEVVSLSKFTPMVMIYSMCQSKLQRSELGKPFKVLFMNKTLPNDNSTLQELKILNSSLSVSFH